MRYHPKSNNGVFSKKQKKASRFMMRNRFHYQRGAKSIEAVPGVNMGAGMLAGLLGMFSRMRRG